LQRYEHFTIGPFTFIGGDIVCEERRAKSANDEARRGRPAGHAHEQVGADELVTCVFFYTKNRLKRAKKKSQAKGACRPGASGRTQDAPPLRDVPFNISESG